VKAKLNESKSNIFETDTADTQLRKQIYSGITVKSPRPQVI